MPDGFNKMDVAFIHNLKGMIRATKVSVIVLTSNREAANTLVSENSLGTIVPLAEAACISKLKRDHGEIVKGVPIDFDWEENVNMVWDKDELKKAMEQTPDFVRLQKGEQASIHRRFDDVFWGLSEVERNEATPVSLIR
jgi:hypothetical protein